MALRKFLVINETEPYHEENTTTDEISLAKVTATGVAGIAFDASSQRIVSVGTPTDSTDAVNKAYVDDTASGLSWKAAVRLATAAALPAYTAAGSGVGKTLTANANAALSVDSVAVAVNDRILVKDEGAGTSTHNGIYTVTATGSGAAAYVLTRATDFDDSPATEVEAGDACFVAEGTANADSGWVMTTNNPVTVDTTALTFAQFNGGGTVTGGAGVLKTGSVLSVELHTAADAQGTGQDGGSSGLEFDVTGDAGKIRVKVNGSGGITRGASGLEIEIDDTPDTLDLGANGLKVTGLPSLFKINGSAVGASVTHTNLDTLVGGASADALHRHGRGDALYTAEEAIAVADPVFISNTTNDRWGKALANTDAKARVSGIARTSAAGDGNTLNITTWGACPGVLSGATRGTPYYLAATGGIATSLPASGNRLIQVGIALNATDLFVRIMDFGKTV